VESQMSASFWGWMTGKGQWGSSGIKQINDILGGVRVTQLYTFVKRDWNICTLCELYFIFFIIVLDNLACPQKPGCFPGGAYGKESTCQCRRYNRCRFDPWVRKIPWRKKWQLTPIFFPGKSHRQRNLEGCSPWGHRESNTTEHLHTHIEILELP